MQANASVLAVQSSTKQYKAVQSSALCTMHYTTLYPKAAVQNLKNPQKSQKSQKSSKISKISKIHKNLKNLKILKNSQKSEKSQNFSKFSKILRILKNPLNSPYGGSDNRPSLRDPCVF